MWAPQAQNYLRSSIFYNIIDKKLRYSAVHMLVNRRTEMIAYHIKSFKDYLKNKSGKHVKAFLSDNGAKLVGHRKISMLAYKVIYRASISFFSPQTN
jgi:hypothetical protein